MGLALAQQALNNESVEKMSKAGLGEDVIISMIQNQVGSYDVTPDAMLSLKQAGVSDKVLAAMAAKNNSPAPVSDTASAKYEDLDIGVYHKVKDEWTSVPAEQVNWKTGGVLKSIATDGIVKGDVNGRLKGGKSNTKVNTPLEFLIKLRTAWKPLIFNSCIFTKRAMRENFVP
jgi:hypothetical protein